MIATMRHDTEPMRLQIREIRAILSTAPLAGEEGLL